MQILAHEPLLMIPTNPEELATILDNYAGDWFVVLEFLCQVAKTKGIEIDGEEVIHKMKELIGDLYE